MCRKLSYLFFQPQVRSCLANFTWFVLLLAIAGCGDKRVAPVNGELARATLIEVLETWKRGGTIAELRARDPEIVVQESHWLQGKVLQDFQLVGDARKEDANLFCEVELTLSTDGGGKPTKKTVTYVVGTDPVLTVFRAIL